jgi:hypothetical protein
MMWLKRVSALALLTSLANVAAIKSGSAAPQEKKEAMMPTFRVPMINLCSRDLSRGRHFIRGSGFPRFFALPSQANRSILNSRRMGSRSASRHLRQPGSSTTFDREEKDTRLKSCFGLTIRMPQ